MSSYVFQELSEDVDVDVVTEIADESEQLEAITTQRTMQRHFTLSVHDADLH